MHSVTPLWRSLRIAEHLCTGAAIALGIAAGRCAGLRLEWVPDVVRWWHERLCHALGVRVEVSGEIAPNSLLVANHVSWLDVPVMGSEARIDFLSKAEVRNWPLIGWMAGIAGTLFITRGAGQTETLVPQIGEHVRRGRYLAIFPEGTTTDGSRLQRFHPRLLGAAQIDGVLVQPVALRYGTNTAPDQVAPFVGNDALLPHLGRLARHPGLRVKIHFLPPLDGSVLARRHICEYCRHAIAEALDIETSSASEPPALAGVAVSLDSSSSSLVKAA
jgi:lyso-ornithine lipid O-acyltransferase